jgi:signal recognition particle subunit SRP54
MKRVEAMIHSMTALERAKPELIDGSRRKRIAAGSGATVTDVSQLVKQFIEMRKMMKKMGGLGRGGKKGKGKAPRLPRMPGQLPPGFPDLAQPGAGFPGFDDLAPPGSPGRN